MKQRTWLCILLSLCISPAFSSLAGLLNVGLSFPKISFNNVGSFALSYTPSNQLFSISATPSLVLFSSVEPPKVITGVRSLQIQFLIDNTGAVAGSSSGNDFVLTGTVTRGTNTYTGVLLTGKIAAFGSLESGVTDQYDFRFTPTGGALLGLFCGDISVQVTSEASTFSGDFTVPFNGRAKGTIGSEDIIPPTIMCPTNIVVESQSFSGGIPGAFVTYATPVVTDNCDQNPTVICTPPSGSVFALPATGSSTNYTVTCVAEDAAGNTNVCSFTITVEDTLPPEFADTNNPIIMCSLTEPMTLTNDAGMCFATYVFPAPFAIDNSSQTNLPAMVSAVDENGASLPVVDLGNGNLEIQFPVNVSGSHVVPITASDGVSTREPDTFTSDGAVRVAVVDFGCKRSILRRVAAAGAAVDVFPHDVDADTLAAYDGVVLSPGPGDPAPLHAEVQTLRSLLGRTPVLGVCLGHQLIGLALGGRTFKLKFGHRGANHPVLDRATGVVRVTSQNHGFALDEEGLARAGAVVSYVNLNDQTVEGLRHTELPLLSIQFHPEASPGPNDSVSIVREFVGMLRAA